MASTTQPVEKRSIASRIGMVLLYIALIVVAIFQIYPLIWLFIFSLKTNTEVFGNSPFALPEDPRWENYVRAWTDGNIDMYFFNSVWITAVSVIATVILASLATFAITRLT